MRLRGHIACALAAVLLAPATPWFLSPGALTEVRAPILILQGARDTLVPPEMGRALAAAASVPVDVWEAPGAGHNDIGPAGGLDRAAEFLARLPRR